MQNMPTILALHRVGYPPPAAKIRGLYCTTALLRFYLVILKNLGYSFRTLAEAMENPSGKDAVITFDDGYRCNIEHAAEILEEFGAKATIFVITDDVGKQNLVWDEAGEKLPADMLSWEEIGRLDELGWEIASHAAQHKHLNNCSRQQQEELIVKSLDEIEKRLGKRPVSFAYPYGKFNRETLSILDEAGILWGVLANGEVPENFLGFNQNLLIPRIPAGGRHLLHYLRAVKTFGVDRKMKFLQGTIADYNPFRQKHKAQSTLSRIFSAND